ncbi:S-adenosylhomocysteine hydrolase [Ralstonia pseudosolanacearum]
MILAERMKRSIARRSDEVFIRSEFAKLGSEAQVSRALKELVISGVIVKLGVGVYAKAKRSVLSGAAIPVKPVDVLAPIALMKLGVTLYPSKNTRKYNAGETTQIPTGNVLNTGERRIARKLGFGRQTIRYENNNSVAG